MSHDLWRLSEKEKQTLRLIVRGHDAKSIARSLGLSVHTINERLRDARRKMAVSSSREAARLLLAAESEAISPIPDLTGDKAIGADLSSLAIDQQVAPIGAGRRSRRHLWIIIGVFVMIISIALLALTALPRIAADPASTPAASSAVHTSDVADAAQQWLTLVDEGRWDQSYRATGAAFRKLNTAEVWATVSQKVRVPLGAVISRTFISQENFPAPPDSFEVVKFRTHFVNKAEAVETVTLDREDNGWHVVAVTIE